MMSRAIPIPVILLISSIVLTDAHNNVISNIADESNQQTNSHVDSNKAANQDFSDDQIEAKVKGVDTFREGSTFDDDATKNSNWNDDIKLNVEIKYKQQNNPHVDDKNTAANEDKFSDDQIETIAKDVETFGDGSKFDVYTAKNSNLGDEINDTEIPKWIKRVKRDFEYIWDNCPGKTSQQLVDGVIKCLPDNDQAGLGDRVFEPLENGSCPTGQRKVQLGRATVCIEDRRRRKNG